MDYRPHAGDLLIDYCQAAVWELHHLLVDCSETWIVLKYYRSGAPKERAEIIRSYNLKIWSRSSYRDANYIEWVPYGRFHVAVKGGDIYDANFDGL